MSKPNTGRRTEKMAEVAYEIERIGIERFPRTPLGYLQISGEYEEIINEGIDIINVFGKGEISENVMKEELKAYQRFHPRSLKWLRNTQRVG